MLQHTDTIENLSHSDTEREEFCRLLAASFYQPEEMFREENVFPRMAELANRFDGELAKTASALVEAFESEDLQDLLLDYTRLFLGPFGILAKPYGSVWLEGENVVMGDSTMAVKALYLEGGFELAEDFKEVPDHIAAELEFLYLLIFREKEALATGDAETLSSVQSLKKRFLDDHLGRWIDPFTTAMHEGAQTRFYQSLATATQRFIRHLTASGEAI